jgi:serine protease AprX
LFLLAWLRIKPDSCFDADEEPTWPDWDGARDWQWHGTMTSTVAAGNGFLSHGLYSGLAHEAEVVLIQVRDSSGHISSASIHRALEWILQHSPELRMRIVDEAVSALVETGISVVAAASNDGQRSLLPPASAPLALTVGGIDGYRSPC